MTEIADFLLARIAEDEHDAYHAQGLLGVVTSWHRVEALRERGLTRADARHVHRWSAARVLAECDAKRRIVGWYTSVSERVEAVPALEPRQNELGMVLRALALPYADHPDYDDEWRP